MARRPGKTYSNPTGYKASLTTGNDAERRRRIRQHNLAWGVSPVPPGYKPGANAPKFPSFAPTETKEDMAERRDELSRLRERSEFSDLSKAPSSDQFAEVLAAAASHGTVEASQYGMHSGRTVQPPSFAGYAKGFEPKNGAGELTDEQKLGIARSVDAEVESRLEAKVTGAAYTGAHSAAEQRQQNLDYQNGMVKRFGEDEARRRLGDRWVETAPVDKSDDGTGPASSEPVQRKFAPGVGGYTVPSRSDSTVVKSGTDEDDNSFHEIPDGSGGQASGSGPAAGSGPFADDEDEDSFHEIQSDAKGGRTSLPRPAARAPAPLPGVTAPSEPSLVFGSREEAAAALVSRGAEMDYPTFAEAAAVASLPGPGDGPDYDPEASFAALATGRISDELLAVAERAEGYTREFEDAYHSSNAEAVALAAGVSPEVYEYGTPEDRLYLQTKFMDSF